MALPAPLPPPPLSPPPPCHQVVKFGELFPETLNAYTYVLLSLGGGAGLGIALYGWAFWVQ